MKCRCGSKRFGSRRKAVAESRRVVITGIGAVSPFGIGVKNYFLGLKEGRSGTRRLSLVDDPDLESRVAGEVPDFNPADHMDSADTKRVPRLIPMAVAAAREALGDSGVELRREVSVIVGTGGGGIEFAERQYEHYFSASRRHLTPYAVSSSFVGMLSSEISIALGFNGASHVISTGCTSSTDAIGYAYRMIRAGMEERVLTGGAEACITRGILAGFGRMKVASTRYNDTPEKASRPFDAERDGFVLSEGAWMLMLESEETARRRGAKIYGEVAGYGSTCEAYNRVAVKEDGVEPARAMRRALEDAGLEADALQCVSLHGTGTRMNDAVETRAVKLLFGSRMARHVPTTALKSMIGHPQGACGAAGVLAGVFSMNEGFIPPTINYENPDPECDLDYTPNKGVPRDVEHVLCNTIAFGSKNSALLLRRAK
ncbi:MAG: beta-ketoacyl synthase [Omnitrophica bacterium RIFCSPHIGHO2_02_FULL_63_14]|nr:MAG: beta-ketoacyl synthase [Omnitrophica bacterium RIFCSPHIGHO2_02_FULL_63_14]